MQLSPEERRRIYEEERRTLKLNKATDDCSGSSTGLEPNVAGLALLPRRLDQRYCFSCNRTKKQIRRFHALQSIVTFGALTVAGPF